MSARVILPGGARAMMASRREPPKSLDSFLTPPWATRALCEALRARCLLRRYGQAWDPACGFGHMSGPLEEYFATVVASDIFAYGGVRELWPPGWWRILDFLDETETTPVVDWIFINPPFNAGIAFALRAIALAQVGVAILVPTRWLAGETRYTDLYAVARPRLIVQYAERVPMLRGRWVPGSSTATDYLWLIWERCPLGKTFDAPRAETIWLPPGQQETWTKPGDIERYAELAAVPLFDPAPALMAAE